MVATFDSGDVVQECQSVHAIDTTNGVLEEGPCVRIDSLWGLALWVTFNWKKRVMIRDQVGTMVYMYLLPDGQEIMLILSPDKQFTGCYTSVIGRVSGVFGEPQEEEKKPISWEADEVLKTQEFEEELAKAIGECDEEAGQELDWQLCDKCQQWFVLTQDDLQCPVCNPREKE